MGLTDYLNAKEQANDLEATLINVDFLGAMSAAYDSISEADPVTGYKTLKMKKLDTPAFRKQFEDAAMGFLVDKSRRYLGVSIPHDVFQENRMLNGYMGFNRNGFHSLVGKLKSKATFNNVYEALGESMGAVIEDIKATPIIKLNAGLDTADVINHTKTAGILDPMKLAREDERELARLLDAYESFGVVPPKFYADKPYKI